MERLKVIFMGTPLCACPFLKFLIEKENVVGVFSGPDTKAGRNMKAHIPEVKELAIDNSINVLQPERLNDPVVIDKIKKMDPDLILVVAYGYKIPNEILSIPKFGSINIHFSLLPKYRGASPVSWAIINGEKNTGVTSFFISEKMDAGDIISQKEIKIYENDNAQTLMNKLIDLGIEVLDETINLIKTNKIKSRTQDVSLISYAPKLNKDLGKINWKNENFKIHNIIRGLFPWPGTYTFFKKDKELLIVKLFDSELSDIKSSETPGAIIDISKTKGILVSCGEKTLWIKNVQLAGNRKISGYDLYVGRKIKVGDVFCNE
jgi:methionyl-tRNA formyltransferase